MEVKPHPIQCSITRGAVNGQVYEIIDYDEYRANFSMYDGRTDVAVKTTHKGTEIVLPLKGKFNVDPIVPGVYNAGCIDFMKYPDEILAPKYIPTNTITMSNTDDIKDLIRSGDAIRMLDEPFVTSPDNITIIPIKDSDQPEMVCLKTALNEKHIDLDKYAGRFGDNFPNDKRQLKSSTATLNIVKRYCKNCDMEAILILKDKNPNVPNPIGREIKVSLTDTSDDSDLDES